MNVLRTIDTHQRNVVAPAHSFVPDAQIRFFTRSRDGVHRRDRRRVVDDSLKMLRQIHHLPQPIENYIFKLG